MDEFLITVQDIIVTNEDIYTGVVRDFLLGVSGDLPREFLRFSLPYVEVPLTYTLLGLSGWAAYKLAYRIGLNLGILHPEVTLPTELRQVVVTDDANQFLADADFDSHPLGRITQSGALRTQKILLAILLYLTIFNQLWIVALVAYLTYVVFWRRKSTVNQAHYADLISWSRGRQKNAALYHAMRARLYRRFYAQHRFTLSNARVFADTLDAAFEAKSYMLG